MSVSISGHFHEGGFGEFSLRRAKENTDFLSMEGWNSEKEDPCDAGSGRGSVACMKIDSARLYKALSMEADNAYAIILSEKKTRRNKIPSFNPARFSAEALSFCSLREKDSGGGSWPYAWALTCQNNLLQEKLTKFREWCACVERRKNGETACHFPNEYFDRSISPEH